MTTTRMLMAAGEINPDTDALAIPGIDITIAIDHILDIPADGTKTIVCKDGVRMNLLPNRKVWIARTSK